MILKMAIEAFKPGLGKSQTGVEVTLSDETRPRCLVPFSMYIPDQKAWEEKHGKKLEDLKFQLVNVVVTSMEAATMGNGIKLQGEIGPDHTIKAK